MYLLTVKSLQNISEGATIALEHLDSNNTSTLGDTVGGRSNSAGDMGPVAVGIGRVRVDGVVSKRGTPTKVNVGVVDAGVDHVGKSASSGAGVVGVGACSVQPALAHLKLGGIGRIDPRSLRRQVFRKVG